MKQRGGSAAVLSPDLIPRSGKSIGLFFTSGGFSLTILVVNNYDLDDK